MNSNECIQKKLMTWQGLVLWHDWRKSALIFSITLTLLLDIATNPVISVISVAGVIALSVCISYCCYEWGIQKLRKSCVVKHPLQRYLDMDVTISKETAEQLAHLLVLNLNPVLLRLRSLFFVEDMLDSLKLLMALCVLNIVGDYVDGMTFLVVGFVLLFTLPKLYEWKKHAINKQLLELKKLKDQLIPSKIRKHLVPTVTVDPHGMETNAKSDNFDGDNTSGQFASNEQSGSDEVTSEYNWQDPGEPPETYQHIKQQ